MKKNIEIGHGNGGIMTHSLIKDLFLKHFGGDTEYRSQDSALLNINSENIAFTTDSFVVNPIFFKGGNIGKLAVCGTVNDLVVSGAMPKYLSCSFIIEEGLPIIELEAIVKSMAESAKEAGVKIVTGDTKVVEGGKVDKIYINTSGIGIFNKKTIKPISKGDKVIITGTLADHGTSILLSRENMDIGTDILSDCAPLSDMLMNIWNLFDGDIRIMKDPTRGGVATTLNEIVCEMDYDILIEETKLPIDIKTRSVCNILGLDPLYIANEGKAIIIVKSDIADDVICELKKHKYGQNSKVIGEVSNRMPGKVILKTPIGTTRIVDMLYSDQLPRIC